MPDLYSGTDVPHDSSPVRGPDRPIATSRDCDEYERRRRERECPSVRRASPRIRTTLGPWDQGRAKPRARGRPVAVEGRRNAAPALERLAQRRLGAVAHVLRDLREARRTRAHKGRGELDPPLSIGRVAPSRGIALFTTVLRAPLILSEPPGPGKSSHPAQWASERTDRFCIVSDRNLDAISPRPPLHRRGG
jgi:hypothetical protein